VVTQGVGSCTSRVFRGALTSVLAGGGPTPARPTRAQIDQAEGLKQKANELFKLKRFQEALQMYQQAADIDPTSAMILCNRAFAHIKLENYGQAVVDADKSIELDPTFIKAYYRRGTARMSLGKTKLALQDFRTVTRLRPSDPTAQAKLKQCEKIVKLEAFEAAIRAQDQPTPLQSLQQTIDEMLVEEDYDGLRWEDGPMTEAFIEDMLERFKNDKRIHKKYLYKIVLQAHGLHERLSNIERLDIAPGKHLTVCGDTHGQFYDVLKIFELNGRPSGQNPYLFNGDYVDRGSWSLEVVTTLLAFKCLDPQAVHLTRGNHETVAMNRMYGFEGEVRAKHSKHMYDCFVDLFTVLPLAFILNGKVFVTHGGLPSPGTTLQDIQEATRRLEPGDTGIVCDLLWSDPQPENGRAPSKRGTVGAADVARTHEPPLTYYYTPLPGCLRRGCCIARAMLCVLHTHTHTHTHIHMIA